MSATIDLPEPRTAADYLRLIAEGWEVIEADGRHLTIQNPEDAGPQEHVIDVEAADLQVSEEISFWREESAAQLETLTLHLTAAPDEPLPAYLSDPWRQLEVLHGALSDALAGRTAVETCEACGKPVRVGDPVISCSEVGDIHATCMGATPDQIAAGSMPCKVEDIDFEIIDDERAAAMRADPRLGITVHSPLYPPGALRAVVDKAGELLAAREAAADAAEPH